MLKLRLMTPDEQDRSGSSVRAACAICRDGFHVCGGCGYKINHRAGSTCPDCWEVIFQGQR